jgi:hypothetical protein
MIRQRTAKPKYPRKRYVPHKMFFRHKFVFLSNPPKKTSWHGGHKKKQKIESTLKKRKMTAALSTALSAIPKDIPRDTYTSTSNDSLSSTLKETLSLPSILPPMQMSMHADMILKKNTAPKNSSSVSFATSTIDIVDAEHDIGTSTSCDQVDELDEYEDPLKSIERSAEEAEKLAKIVREKDFLYISEAEMLKVQSNMRRRQHQKIQAIARTDKKRMNKIQQQSQIQQLMAKLEKQKAKYRLKQVDPEIMNNMYRDSMDANVVQLLPVINKLKNARRRHGGQSAGR